MDDDVLNELRQVKEDIATEHNHDIGALFAYFKSTKVATKASATASRRHVAREGGLESFPNTPAKS
jgi:hypothetical protein